MMSVSFFMAYRSFWKFWQASTPATIRRLLKPRHPDSRIAPKEAVRRVFTSRRWSKWDTQRHLKLFTGATYRRFFFLIRPAATHRKRVLRRSQQRLWASLYFHLKRLAVCWLIFAPTFRLRRY